MHDQLKTLFVGRNFIKFDEIDSTNIYLKACAEEGNLPEGTVVTADYQWHGRGQRGTQWESNAGKNLLLSVLFYPKFLKATEQFLLSQTVALAVCDFISYNLDGEDVKIKWPNDILVNEQKIAGILIENILQGQFLKASVVGIGINVNQNKITFPGATSFMLTSNKFFDLDKLTYELCNFLEAWYLQLRQGNSEKIRDNYHEKLFGLGKELSFQENESGEYFSGTIKGVSSSGRLQIADANILKEFDLKEIKFIF